MNPGSFLHFVTDVVRGLPDWSPAQRVYIRVVFDREEPGNLESPDRETARELFGDVDTIPEAARHVVCSLKGARIGGTLVHSLYLLFAGLTQPLAGLALGEVAFGAIVAPDLRLAAQAFRYVQGAATQTPQIARYVTAPTSNSVTLCRPHDGRLVTIECLPATRGGSAVRGRSYFAGLLDEASFFRDSDSVVNDDEIYKAIAPRILPGGLLALVSTVFSESGLLWEKVSAEFGAPRTCLPVKARTLTMRNEPRMVEFVADEYERDPVNAAREFDLTPYAAGAGLFFASATISDAVDPHHATPQPFRHGLRVGIGVDTGLIHDSSAAVVVHKDGASLVVAEVIELRPSKGAPLKLSDVCQAYGDLMLRHVTHRALADNHELEPSREYLAPRGLTLTAAPSGNEGKLTAYLRVRELLNQSRLRLPANEPRLVKQLREVQSRPLPGGLIRIQSPRRGGHGDLVSALVNAVWMLTGTSNSMFDFLASEQCSRLLNNQTIRDLGPHQ